MPAAEYDAWLAREAMPAPAAVERRRAARAVRCFLAAGCGACHAVRGTAASGTIGPDLTHLGSAPLGRHRHAAARPPTTSRASSPTASTSSRATGCREFRIFSADEHDALAAYLLSLR